MTRRLGMRLREYPKLDPAQVTIEFADSFPMWMRIDPISDTSVALVGIVRTVGLPGDRSDYHDLISMIWAASLRSLNVASVRLVDIPHPAVPGELYGRYVLFDKQPSATYVSLTAPDYSLIESILVASKVAARLFSRVYKECGGDPETEDCCGPEAEAWARSVSDALDYTAEATEGLFNHRRNPNWLYCRRSENGVVAFRLQRNLIPLLTGEIDSKTVGFVEALDSYLVQTGSIKNAISKKAIRRISKLAHAYGLKTNRRFAGLLDSKSLLVLPVESHVICVTDRGISALEFESGYRPFLRERALLQRRHQTEARFLHSAVSFLWSPHLDGSRFESLVLDLLKREPGVEWARQVGGTAAADADRDIIVDWLQPAPRQEATKVRAVVRRRVVVQCKAYASAINRSKVPDIPQVLDLHAAAGYLLVAYPRITPQVVDYMTRVPQRRGFWADWWTQVEIEDRLRANLDVARRYRDLVGVAL